MYSPRRLVKPVQRVIDISYSALYSKPPAALGPTRKPRKGRTRRMRFNRRIVEMSRSLETPVLLLDRASLRRAYARLRAALPAADSYFAVKGNPHPEVLRTLAA